MSIVSSSYCCSYHSAYLVTWSKPIASDRSAFLYGLASVEMVSWGDVCYQRMPIIGKLNLSCNVIVVKHMYHQVIVFE